MVLRRLSDSSANLASGLVHMRAQGRSATHSCSYSAGDYLGYSGGVLSFPGLHLAVLRASWAAHGDAWRLCDIAHHIRVNYMQGICLDHYAVSNSYVFIRT